MNGDLHSIYDQKPEKALRIDLAKDMSNEFSQKLKVSVTHEVILTGYIQFQ